MFRLSPGHLMGEGPWSSEVIREALRQGKLSLKAQACRADSPGAPQATVEWRALQDFPEFHDLIQATGGVRPPDLPHSSPDSQRIPASNAEKSVPPLPRSAPSDAKDSRPKISLWAVASVVLGFLGFFLITGIASLVCGWKGLSQIRKGQGRWYGKGLAWFGIALATLTMVLTVTAFVLIFRAFHTGHFPGPPPRPVPAAMTCHQRLLKLGEAVRGYALDHGDLLPSASNWCDAVREYAASDEIFLCPQAGGAGRLSFAYNAAIAGLNIEELPGEMIVLYEGEGGVEWNRSGGPELAVERNGGVWVYRADGNVTHLTLLELKEARWKP